MSKTRKDENYSSHHTYQTTLDIFLNLKKPLPNTTQQPLLLKKNKRRHDDTATPSLYAFLKSQNNKRRKTTLENIHSQQQTSAKSPIVISYRPERDGRGALYDHRAVQVISQWPTVVAKDEATSINGFHRQVRDATFVFQGQFDNYYGRTIPPLLSEINTQQGLLMIPGVSSTEYTSSEYQVRKAFEFKLVQKARNCGQPMMGICGGSWVIWEAFGGEITKVTDHSFRSGMPRLLESGKVGNNKQIHRIALQPKARLLEAALAFDESNPVFFPVNSVHSYAVDAATLPEDLQISAVAKQDDSLAPISAHSEAKEKMKPTENSVEAFESVYGAPILGVQWHPEAYTNNLEEISYSQNQQHLLNYMIQAGQTFKNRQLVNKELLENKDTVKNRLNKVALIGNNNGVCRRKTCNSIYFSLFKLQKTNALRHRKEALREIQMMEDYLISKGHRIV